MKLKIKPKVNQNGEGSASLGFKTLRAHKTRSEYHQLTYVRHTDGSCSGAFSTQQKPKYFLVFNVIRRKDSFDVQHMSTDTVGVKWTARTIEEVCKRLGKFLAKICETGPNEKELSRWILEPFRSSDTNQK